MFAVGRIGILLYNSDTQDQPGAGTSEIDTRQAYAVGHGRYLPLDDLGVARVAILLVC